MIAFNIQNMSHEVALHNIVTVLRLDFFVDSLCKKSIADIVELEEL